MERIRISEPRADIKGQRWVRVWGTPVALIGPGDMPPLMWLARNKLTEEERRDVIKAALEAIPGLRKTKQTEGDWPDE